AGLMPVAIPAPRTPAPPDVMVPAVPASPLHELASRWWRPTGLRVLPVPGRSWSIAGGARKGRHVRVRASSSRREIRSPQVDGQEDVHGTQTSTGGRTGAAGRHAAARGRRGGAVPAHPPSWLRRRAPVGKGARGP